MKKAVFNRFAKVNIPALAPFSRNGWLYMFDQKTGIVYSEKLDLPDGYYELPMENEFIKVSELSDDAPIWNDHFVCSTTIPVSKKDMEIIKLVSSQAGKDDLRPVMKATCIQNKKVIATNANTLVFMDVETKLNTLFEFDPVLPIKDCHVSESIVKTTNSEKKYVVFLCDKIQIAIPKVEDKYPNWESVIPKQENPKAVRITRKQISEIIQFQKTFKCQTAAISGNKLTIYNTDLSFSKTWVIEYGLIQDSNPCGVIMPMSITKEYEIGFSIDFLHRVMLNADNIILSYVEENRAGMISYHYDSVKKEEKPVKKEVERLSVKDVTPPIATLAQENPIDIKIIRYSEKSIVVTGEGTKAIKEKLIEAGGCWNKYLKKEDGTFKGWVFSAKKEEIVKSLIS